jgi:hypothetical protein
MVLQICADIRILPPHFNAVRAQQLRRPDA